MSGQKSKPIAATSHGGQDILPASQKQGNSPERTRLTAKHSDGLPRPITIELTVQEVQAMTEGQLLGLVRALVAARRPWLNVDQEMASLFQADWDTIRRAISNNTHLGFAAWAHAGARLPWISVMRFEWEVAQRFKLSLEVEP